MSPRITITFEVPEGTEVRIAGLEGGEDLALTSARTRDPVEEYWTGFLTDNGRTIYGAAARIEDLRGPGYSFEDLAEILSVDYETVKSYHRNSGRTARRWQNEKGTAAPIRLEFSGEYGPQEGVKGWRTRYRLPNGVADKVVAGFASS